MWAGHGDHDAFLALLQCCHVNQEMRTLAKPFVRSCLPYIDLQRVLSLGTWLAMQNAASTWEFTRLQQCFPKTAKRFELVRFGPLRRRLDALAIEFDESPEALALFHDFRQVDALAAGLELYERCIIGHEQVLSISKTALSEITDKATVYMGCVARRKTDLYAMARVWKEIDSAYMYDPMQLIGATYTIFKTWTKIPFHHMKEIFLWRSDVICLAGPYVPELDHVILLEESQRFWVMIVADDTSACHLGLMALDFLIRLKIRFLPDARAFQRYFCIQLDMYLKALFTGPNPPTAAALSALITQTIDHMDPGLHQAVWQIIWATNAYHFKFPFVLSYELIHPFFPRLVEFLERCDPNGEILLHPAYDFYHDRLRETLCAPEFEERVTQRPHALCEFLDLEDIPPSVSSNVFKYMDPTLYESDGYDQKILDKFQTYSKLIRWESPWLFMVDEQSRFLEFLQVNEAFYASITCPMTQTDLKQLILRFKSSWDMAFLYKDTFGPAFDAYLGETRLSHFYGMFCEQGYPWEQFDQAPTFFDFCEVNCLRPCAENLLTHLNAVDHAYYPAMALINTLITFDHPATVYGLLTAKFGVKFHEDISTVLA